ISGLKVRALVGRSGREPFDAVCRLAAVEGCGGLNHGGLDFVPDGSVGRELRSFGAEFLSLRLVSAQRQRLSRTSKILGCLAIAGERIRWRVSFFELGCDPFEPAPQCHLRGSMVKGG